MSLFAILRRAALAGAALALLAAAPAGAVLLASCAFSPGSSVEGDGIDRGFYLSNYPGQSLHSIRLRHYASVAGSYRITVTARAGNYGGAIIGEPYTAFVTLGSNSNSGTNVLYELGDMPVTPGSTIAFSMTAAGPGSVYFDTALASSCSNVTETDGTSVPLSFFRRSTVGYQAYGRADTETFYSCPFGTSGDLIERGIYVTNYPGRTLRTVGIRYEANTAGSRTIRLTAREGGFNGSVIGTPQTKTINFAAGTAGGQIIDWDFGGAFVSLGSNITFSHELLAGGTLYHSPTTAASCPGVVETEGTTGTLDTARGTRGIRIKGDREAGYRKVVEYYIPSLNHYFVSGRPNEQALLDSLPGSFTRTGASFLGFPSTEAPQGSAPVCRFYLPAPGPNTHFYGQPADCNAINALGSPQFQFEGYDFAVYTPVAGACPSYAPYRVYRSFNNRSALNDANHRYTTNVTNYNTMTGLGWAAEGAVFCSDVVLP